MLENSEEKFEKNYKESASSTKSLRICTKGSDNYICYGSFRLDSAVDSVSRILHGV